MSEQPEQLPVIRIRHPTVRFGYIDVAVPVKWDEFMGMDKVRQVADAMSNITVAVHDTFLQTLKDRGHDIDQGKPPEIDTAKLAAEIAAKLPSTPAQTQPGMTSISSKPAAEGLPPGVEEPPQFGENITFFSGKYGYTLYCDPEVRDDIYEWILSVPKELRGRKTAEPKLPDENEKAIWNINEKEKKLITRAAEIQETRVYEKEGKY